MGDTDATVEGFVPKFVPGHELIELPDGDVGVAFGEASYLRFGAEDRTILEGIDGERSLSEVLVAASSVGRLKSIRCLVRVVQTLGRGGALSNPAKKMKALGFSVTEQSGSIIERCGLLLLRPRIASAALAGWVSGIFLILGKLSPPPLLLWGLLAGSLGVALGFLGEMASGLSARPLAIGGEHSRGFLAVYAGLVAALLGRDVLRAVVLGGYGQKVSRVGVKAPLFVLGLELETRNIFRAGREGETHLALAGITGASCVSSVFLVWATLQPDAAGALAQAGLLASVGAALVVLVLLCPFGLSDASIWLDRLYPSADARRHAEAYIRKKYLRGIASKSFFEGEGKIILMLSVSVVWLYLGLLFCTRTLSSIVLESISYEFFEQGSTLGIVLSMLLGGVLVALMIGFLLLFVVFLLRLVAGVKAAWAGKPKVGTADHETEAEMVHSNPLFALLKEGIQREVVARLQCLKFKAEQDILSQGEVGQWFCILAEGKAEVLTEAESGMETFLETLKSGDSFGEMALLEDSVRTATVRAVTDVTVYALDRDNFLEAVGGMGLSLEKVTRTLRTSSAIRKSKIFGDLSADSLRRLREMFVEESVGSGKVVISEGDVGDRFYLIERGKVTIEKKGNYEDVESLGPGDVFGEVALLLDIPRTATVRAVEPSVFLALDRGSFQGVMRQNFTAGIRLESYLDVRRSGSKP